MLLRRQDEREGIEADQHHEPKRRPTTHSVWFIILSYLSLKEKLERQMKHAMRLFSTLTHTHTTYTYLFLILYLGYHN